MRRQLRPSEVKRSRSVTVPEFSVSGLLQAIVVPIGCVASFSLTSVRMVATSDLLNIGVLRKVVPYCANAAAGVASSKTAAMNGHRGTRRPDRPGMILRMAHSPPETALGRWTAYHSPDGVLPPGAGGLEGGKTLREAIRFPRCAPCRRR